MVSIFYFVTAISTSIGVFILVVGLAAARGAPQEAAVAALAIAMAVIPYVFTRCIQISLDRSAQLSVLKDIRAALLKKGDQASPMSADETAPSVGAPVARKNWS